MLRVLSCQSVMSIVLVMLAAHIAIAPPKHLVAGLQERIYGATTKLWDMQKLPVFIYD